MKKEFKIGVVGAGFVGGAILAAHPGALFYDPHKEGSVPHLEQLMAECNALFLCLPTPVGENGLCDVSILRETLTALVDFGYDGAVICKSTAPANIYTQYSSFLRLVYVPEFLRAVSAVDDYQGAEYFILGGAPADTNVAQDVIASAPCFNDAMGFAPSFYPCGIREAVAVKYFTNAFLASKVSLFNEYRRVAQYIGADWDAVVRGLALDARIGEDHTAVPGPDGLCGWGGACFPKDTAALLAVYGNVMPLLRAIVDQNTQDRARP